MTVMYRQKQPPFQSWHALLLSLALFLHLHLIAYSTSLALFTPFLPSLFLPPRPEGIFKYKSCNWVSPSRPDSSCSPAHTPPLCVGFLFFLVMWPDVTSFKGMFSRCFTRLSGPLNVAAHDARANGRHLFNVRTPSSHVWKVAGTLALFFRMFTALTGHSYGLFMIIYKEVQKLWILWTIRLQLKLKSKKSGCKNKSGLDLHL